MGTLLVDNNLEPPNPINNGTRQIKPQDIEQIKGFTNNVTNVLSTELENKLFSMFKIQKIVVMKTPTAEEIIISLSFQDMFCFLPNLHRQICLKKAPKKKDEYIGKRLNHEAEITIIYIQIPKNAEPRQNPMCGPGSTIILYVFDFASI
jgi:hypothetical protein